MTINSTTSKEPAPAKANQGRELARQSSPNSAQLSAWKNRDKLHLLCQDLVRSIHVRPPECAAIYQKYWNSFVPSVSDRRKPLQYRDYFAAVEKRENLGDETIYELLCATAFVAAWCNLHDDRAGRNQTVRATVSALVAAGVPEIVIKKQITTFETLFAQLLALNGVHRSQFPIRTLALSALGCAGVISILYCIWLYIF